MHYTKEQKRAIHHGGGNLQLIACAGSGKTQVLAERIVRLLKSGEAKPENIIAFTFTKKAAGELKDRVYQLARKKIGHDTGLADMYVGTIHAFCLEFIQEYVQEYLKCSVLSEVQQRLFIDRNSRKCGMSDLKTLKDGKPLQRWKDSKVFQKVLDIVRQNELTLELNDLKHPVQKARQKYEKLLLSHGFMDYTMIVLEAVKALHSRKDIQKKVGNRVKHVIVDEYQDVNPLQECLIKLLHDLGARICVVGDDDQTIYQWNGSDIKNILSFTDRYPRVETITMGKNFRSSEAIVNTARGVAERNGERLSKIMESASCQVFERGDLVCRELGSPVAEAEWMAVNIAKMRGLAFRDTPGGDERGLDWSDFAILLRSTKNTAQPVVEALDAAGIPCVVKGMNGLFDRPEVHASALLFHYLDGQIPKKELLEAWRNARLALDAAKLNSAVDELDAFKAQWASMKRKSNYAPQGVYFRFLGTAGCTEENLTTAIGTDLAEAVFYNLGAFSQVVADFEQIHFHSDVDQLYTNLSGFLRHQAPGYYPEGTQSEGYATPNAVQIMTVHQAKGMEFPVVFLPCLVAHRFPSKRQGGRSWYHLIPEHSVKSAEALKGREEDERRLFYVALTRAKKFLFCSWAPKAPKGMYSQASSYFRELTRTTYFLTREMDLSNRQRLAPKGQEREIDMSLSFSELKYFFECPRDFKFRFMYGFKKPISEEMGFGKSLHDALAEIHTRAMENDIPGTQESPAFVSRHLHLPFANKRLFEQMEKKAEAIVRTYLWTNRELLPKTQYAEKQIEIPLGDGIVINGRIDLIRRQDTNETEIIDFKSNDRTQEEEVTRTQLHTYALGYRQLTGTDADLLTIYNLDDQTSGNVREAIDQSMITKTRDRIVDAGNNIRGNTFPCTGNCGKCDFQGICKGV